VSAVTLYVHDEEALAGEFPLHDLVRILLAVQECYYLMSGTIVTHSHQGRKVALPVSLANVADYLGVNPSTVTRIRQRTRTPDGAASSPAPCG
jgi:hypothetical protein